MVEMYLLCNIEPAGEMYGPGESYFALNLSVAFKDGSVFNQGDVVAFLQPWNWTIGDIKLREKDAASVWSDVATTKVNAPVGFPKTDLLRKEFTDKLSEQFIGSSFAPTKFTYSFDASPQGSRQEHEIDSDDVEIKGAWHAALMHVSTYPYPVPHLLNLVQLFKANVNSILGEFVAAPEFAITLNGVPYSFTLQPTNVQTNQGFEEWTYSVPVGGAHSCIALMSPAKKADSLYGAVDMQTGWVKNTGSFLATDWSRGLKASCSALFDLPKLGFEFNKELGEIFLDSKSKNNSALLSELLVLGWAGFPENSFLIALEQHLISLVSERESDSAKRVAAVALVNSLFNKVSQKWPAVAANWNLFQNELSKQCNDPDADLEMLWGATAKTESQTKALELLLSQVVDGDPQKDQWAPYIAILCTEVVPNINPKAARLTALIDLHWASLADLSAPLPPNFPGACADPKYSTFYTKLAARPSDQQRFVCNLVERIQKYALGRLGLDPNEQDYAFIKPNVQLVPTDPTHVVKLKQFIKDYVIKFAIENPLKNAVEPDVADTATLAESLVLKIGGLNEVSATDDVRTRINGFGVLIRQSGKPNWSCLNLADIRVPPYADLREVAYNRSDVLAACAVVPSRLCEVDSFQTTTISYSNRPLISESPDALYSNEGFESAVDSFDSCVLYSNTYGRPQADGKIVTLPRAQYGIDYDMAVFRILSGGLLAKSIASTHPAVLSQNYETVIVDPTSIFVTSFRRSIPVSAPRLITQELPTIPQDVFPLARSLEKILDFQSTQSKSPTPLLFLYDTVQGANNHTFQVRPPSIDLDVFDRWSGAELDKNARIEIFADIFKCRDENLAKGRTKQKGFCDETIDDPAVTSYLIQAERQDALANVSQTLLTVSKPPGTGLKSLQSIPVHFNVQIAESKATDLSVSGNGSVASPLTLLVPRGQVWKLTICSAVLKSCASKFQSKYWNSAPRYPSAVGETHRLFGETTLLVEVATRTMPTENELFRAVSCVHDSKSNNLLVNLASSPTSGQAPTVNSSHYLSRIEVIFQRWRWQGRPLPDGFDFYSDLQQFEAMDGALFGERSRNDYTVHEARVDFSDPANTTSELVAIPLFANKGADYFRVAIRAHSRYEGIYPNTSRDTRDSQKPGIPDSWIRTKIAPRRLGDLPAPKVKMVVPLTEPLTDSITVPNGQPIPGLLVILEEPWFALGGLAENFKAEIVETVTQDQQQRFLEFGYDPILSYEVAPTQVESSKPSPIGVLNCKGPIGYTFDTDTDAPKLVNTSFIVPAPEFNNPLNSSLAWSFAKLRFQRTIKHENGQETLSPFTPGVWCQYLPPASHYNFAAAQSAISIADRLRVSTLQLVDISTDQSASKLCLIEPKNYPYRLIPQPEQGLSEDSTIGFKHLVLVTARLTDAFGKNSCESFLGFYEFEDSGFLKQVYPPTSVKKSPSVKLVARVLEIQFKKHPASTDWSKLIELLFPNLSNDVLEHLDYELKDCEARIVRISEPCEQGTKEPYIATYSQSAVDVIKSFNSPVYHLYLDARERLAIGFGSVIDSADEAAELTMVYPKIGELKNIRLVTASDDEKRFEFENIRVAPSCPGDPDAYRALAQLLMSDSEMEGLFHLKMRTAERNLKTVFAEYESYPKDVKTALLDMMYDLGATKFQVFVQFQPAIKSRNWKLAAQRSQRSRVSAERNQFIYTLLANSQ
ncbi:hypothetical protein KBF38_22685 [bacterium]|nr:hypothetical protein [bacterium]